MKKWRKRKRARFVFACCPGVWLPQTNGRREGGRSDLRLTGKVRLSLQRQMLEILHADMPETVTHRHVSMFAGSDLVILH